MRKFFSIIITITLLSLCYVNQQTKLIEYSYRINNSNQKLCFLIDQNESLRYNVASLKSPGTLRQRLAKNNIVLDTAQNWRSIRLAKSEKKEAKKELTYEKSFVIAAKTLISTYLPKSEAIAQELD